MIYEKDFCEIKVQFEWEEGHPITLAPLSTENLEKAKALFLKSSNGEGRKKAKKRIFADVDFDVFLQIWLKGWEHALQNKPFYWEMNAGAVEEGYHYMCHNRKIATSTSTAQCYVYVDPTSREVDFNTWRASINGPKVPHPVPNGLEGYNQMWVEEAEKRGDAYIEEAKEVTIERVDNEQYQYLKQAAEMGYEWAIEELEEKKLAGMFGIIY